MKEVKNSLFPDDWLRYARKDRKRVYQMLKIGDTEAAAYYLQQSLEKYIKVFLLKSGWSLKKIHDLDVLLDDAVKYNPSLELFRTICKRISAYYLVQRYPLPASATPKKETVEKEVEDSKNLIKALFPAEEING